MCVEGCVGGVFEIIISHEVFPQRGQNILHGGVINQGPIRRLDIIINDEFTNALGGIGISHKLWWGNDIYWVATADPANPSDIKCCATCHIGHRVSLFRGNRGKC